MSLSSLPPSIRDNYEIIRKLGEGLSGITYEVISKKDNQKYVIKIYDIKKIQSLGKILYDGRELEPIPILRTMLHNNEIIRKLLREKTCENIKKIYDVGDINKPYVITEYLEYNLRDYVRERGISHLDAIKIILDVVRGLKFVFNNTELYCHGDVSPDNIFITERKGEIIAKIGDFEGARYPTVSAIAPLFKPEYKPRERIPDRLGKYDVYALGVIIAELILKEEEAMRIKEEGGEAINEFVIPQAFKNLIRKSAAIQRDERFTLDEFLDAIRSIYESILKEKEEKKMEREKAEERKKDISKIIEETKNVTSLYLNILEGLRRNFDLNKFKKIKEEVDPKFDELIRLGKKGMEESPAKVEELISYLKNKLDKLS
ncbi:MAG: protein kinase [Nitrososphaerota archaeon]